MSRRKRQRLERVASSEPPELSEASHLASIVEAGSLALTIAVIAGRSLFPSEDAATGSAYVWILLELLAAPALVANWMLAPRGPRPGAVTWLWLALVGLVWVSASQAVYRFPATIMAWEWTGVAAVCLLVRQQSTRLGPAPFVVLIAALVLGQALTALYQVAVEFPDLQRRYEQRDPMVLDEMRAIGVAPGTPGEARFRDRLYASEPYGTFGHPNSLAGFLALGLPLWIAAAIASAAIPGRRLRTAQVAIALLIVAIALVVTSCFSAWAGLLVGLGCWLIVSAGGRRFLVARWRKLVVLAVLGAGLVAWGATNDRMVERVRNAAKSFGYRLEWWQGGWGVFTESPLLGVGFGNFGAHYLKYKLPFSSEEIQDPHNFVLELACAGGVLLPVVFLAIVALSFRELGLHRRPGEDVPENGLPTAQSAGPARAGWNVASGVLPIGLGLSPSWWTGASLGGLLAGALQLASWSALAGYAIGLASVGLLNRQRLSVPNGLQRGAILAGVLAMGVHWMAAGGVGYPSLLLCTLGLLASARQPAANDDRPAPRFPVLAALVGVCVLLIVGYLVSVFFPFQRRDQFLAESRTIETSRSPRALDSLRKAAEMVPGDASGWTRLAGAHTARMGAERPQAAKADYLAAIAAWKRAIELDPRHAAHYYALAQLNREAARRGMDESALDRAIEAFEEANRRYPNSAMRRWELGEALFQAGRIDEAKVQFERALELDQTPHPDKKLGDEQRQMARRVTQSRAS